MRVNSFQSHVINILFTVLLFPFFIISIIVISGTLLIINKNLSIFFTQIRLGKSGNPFLIFKFKTLENGEYSNQFSKFLRKSGLDETPQLYNILKGDMHVFGPRPKLLQEIPEEQYNEYNDIVLVRYPGLFSLFMSQIGPGESLCKQQNITNLLKYEKYEQRNWSLKLVFIIFFRCLKKSAMNCLNG